VHDDSLFAPKGFCYHAKADANPVMNNPVMNHAQRVSPSLELVLIPPAALPIISCSTSYGVIFHSTTVDGSQKRQAKKNTNFRHENFQLNPARAMYTATLSL